LNIYDIVKRQVLTSKSSADFNKFRRITLEVNRAANKLMIAGAVEKIWDVKVEKVRVISLPGKKKTFAKRSFRTSSKKKAVVTLKKGYKVDIPGLMEGVKFGSAGSQAGENE
jgi:large subunit ribosomal protein L23